MTRAEMMRTLVDDGVDPDLARAIVTADTATLRAVLDLLDADGGEVAKTAQEPTSSL